SYYHLLTHRSICLTFFFFFYSYVDHRDLHSFPTRRSSDLQQWPGVFAASLCLANAFFAWKWLPESKKPHANAPARKPVWHGVWAVLRNPTGDVQRLTLIYAVAMLAFSSLSSVLALYLSAEFAITEKTIG